MKKKLISVIMVMALALGTYTVAMADGTTPANATRNSLKSFGNVVYTDGENSVEIYSEDLVTIADKLDTYKTIVFDQLGEINTYFSTGEQGTSTVSDSDIKIVHTAPSDSESVDPLALDFDTLLEGLAASQSIPTDVTEYGYDVGTFLYKTPTGELTTDGTQDDVEQISISAATPENLSAGSAAWVNGELILGTGADNKAYYNLNKCSNDTTVQYVGLLYNHNSSSVTKGWKTATGYASSVSTTKDSYQYGKSQSGRSDKIEIIDTMNDEPALLYSLTFTYTEMSNIPTEASGSGSLRVNLCDENGTVLASKSASTTNSKSYNTGSITIKLFDYNITTSKIYVTFSVGSSAKGRGSSHSATETSMEVSTTFKATYYIPVS